MTRPGIVRADTLDLQDQENPSAQDHTRSYMQHVDFGDQLIGAHQAQEIRHITRERQEEEHNLQQAWSSGSTDSLRGDHSVGSGAEEVASGNDAETDTASDEDMMDRISSSPSIDDEDIDFDFVYALHTFVATVEGQANATKGDTMVLLDDSNSYWWLVRIVKDSSIGYLPAEHIETPTERLARLNKHRNVDLSAAMLGDNAERKKNPLKKAMKRRGGKSVTFVDPAANRYVEASDYEYTSDEEDGTAEMRIGLAPAAEATASAQQQTEQQSQQQQQQQQAEQQQQQYNQQQAHSVSSDPGHLQNQPDGSLERTGVIESPPLSPKLQEVGEATPLKSRNGTPRNAESFIKDETAETRKFTLTPNLLRDDSMGAGPRLREVTPVRNEGTDPFMTDKESAKEEKRKKEKKQRTFSGLFKSRKKDKEKDKDQKGRTSEEMERVSSDTMRSNTNTIGSMEGSPNAKDMDRKSSQKGRKLQKSSAGSSVSTTPLSISPQISRSSSHPAELEGSQVAHEAPTGYEDEIRIQPAAPAPVSLVPRSTGAPPPKRAMYGGGLSDLGEESEDSASHRNGSFMHGTEIVHIPAIAPDYASSDDGHGDSHVSTTVAAAPVAAPVVAPVAAPVEAPIVAPVAVEPAREASPAPSSVAEIMEMDEMEEPTQTHGQAAPHTLSTAPESTEPARQGSKSSTTTTATTGTTASSRAALSPSPASTANYHMPTSWSDASLLAWAEGENDVRDMLTIIYDAGGSGGATTAEKQQSGKHHPWVKELFSEEQSKLDRLSSELDGLLQGYLARRGEVNDVAAATTGAGGAGSAAAAPTAAVAAA